MIFLRSALYLALVAVLTVVITSLLLICFWLPTALLRRLSMGWVAAACWLIEHVLGIRYRVLGMENIPSRPPVILCKHQSAWETIFLQRIFRLPSFVYKKELHWLPFFGWALALMPFVAIDRNAGKEALNQVASRGKHRLEEGYPVVVFPEGTRVPPGQKKRYKVGGGYLAAKAGAPVVPIALNSGEFWRRQAFLKRPGVVTVSIGPAIDPEGLTPEDITRRAEEWIESEMRRISPHLYPNEAEGSPASPAA